MAVCIICLGMLACLMICVVLVELEVHLIHVVVVLCSVRDRFLTRSEEIVRVCILFLTLFVNIVCQHCLSTLFCVLVFVVQTIPCFPVYIFPSVLHILAIKSNSDQERQRFGL